MVESAPPVADGVDPEAEVLDETGGGAGTQGGGEFEPAFPGLGGKLGCCWPTPLGSWVRVWAAALVDKTGVEVVVGGSMFEPLPLWFEKTGATLLIGLPLLFANLKQYEKKSREISFFVAINQS